MSEPAHPTGYEKADAPVWFVTLILACGAVLAGLLHLVVWGFYRTEIPASAGVVEWAVVTPGEPPVNSRLEAIPKPRLDELVELSSQPPGYRSSTPVPLKNLQAVRPEDLRPESESRLGSYGWVSKSKRVAHIPIERAMAIIANESQASRRDR